MENPETNLIISNLRKKYSLNKLEVLRLNSELEILKLKIDYTLHMAKKKKTQLYPAFVKYAALGRITQKLTKKEKIKLKKLVKNPKELLLFLLKKQDSTKEICKHKKPKTCFRYTIYNNEGVNIHFTNAIIPKNPFKGKEYEKLKLELKKIAKELSKQPNLKYVFGVSWVRNLKPYLALFPKGKLVEWKKNKHKSQGHWGQFYRYDGSLNQKRIKQFRKNWKFPLKTYLNKCSIKSFLEMYLE